MSIFGDVKRIFNNLLMMDELLADTGWKKRISRMSTYQDYYDGNHRKTLKTRENQADDNISINLMGLVVERSISLLIGNGIDFDFGDGKDEIKDEIDSVFEANKSNILLHKLAQFASINGTGYAKLQPEGLQHPENNEAYITRIIPLNPIYMTIETEPDDIDDVRAYIMRWNTNMNGKETARKEVTEKNWGEGETGEEITVIKQNGWKISNYYANADTQGKWMLMDEILWDYDFPPIIHWQNLPNAADVYGTSDLKDIINLNDRLNFIASNISKIIRYHGHPKTWGRGKGFGATASWGADEIVMLQGDSGMLQNLEMTSDLVSSQQFFSNIRQLIFDISRTVDITSISDKVGALTNFGLRVLFFDSIAKLNTKQKLIGEAIREIIRRILVISGNEPINCKVVFPATLPIDETEQTEVFVKQQGMGIVSKETVSEKSGYEWTDEQKRMESEQSSEKTVGQYILDSFNKGL